MFCTLLLFRYIEQDSMVDLVFPPIGKDGFDPEFKIMDYSSFGYWRENIEEVDSDSVTKFLAEDDDGKQ